METKLPILFDPVRREGTRIKGRIVVLDKGTLIRVGTGPVVVRKPLIIKK